jgi:hypothetical protein
MKLERPFPTRAHRAPWRELPPHTDWSRILHCDITGTCGAGPSAWRDARKEIDMTAPEYRSPRAALPTADPARRGERGPTRPHTEMGGAPAPAPLRSPLKQGALLLAIYVAMYGTVGMLAHVAHVVADGVAASIRPVHDDAGVRPAPGPARDTDFCTSTGEEQPCARA